MSQKFHSKHIKIYLTNLHRFTINQHRRNKLFLTQFILED